jgi:Holliday junction resolvase RusA-like endonuclease
MEYGESMNLEGRNVSKDVSDESGDARQSLAGGRVVIDVIGRPRTKGSLIPVHTKIAPGKCRVSLKESGEYSEAWKKTMIRAVRSQCEVARYAGAVRVDTFFRFARICLPDQSMAWPVREKGEFAHGDEDKLRRNALDALTQSGLIADDSLVVGGSTWKRYVQLDESIHATESEGVTIVVSVAPGVADALAMESLILRGPGFL